MIFLSFENKGNKGAMPFDFLLMAHVAHVALPRITKRWSTDDGVRGVGGLGDMDRRDLLSHY